MELTKIRGISDKREQEFNKLNVYNTADLIRFFPRAYLDLRSQQLLRYVYHNDFVLTCAKIISEPTVRYYRKNSGMVKVTCQQEGLIFTIIWFNNTYVLNKLKVGEEYLFYGRVRKEGDAISMANPTFEPCDKVFRLQGIVPQYHAIGTLSQKIVRDSARLAVNIEKPKSIIPERLQAKYQLKDLYWAYREIHNPTDFKSVAMASERIAVEEYFSLISAFKFIKGGREQVRLNKYSVGQEQVEDFIKNTFPFEFTLGQKKAVSEIFADMNGAKVMNRLMQGDVGSGKTAVSLCALYVAQTSGYQSVMLAPTEVLAKQNFNAVKRALPNASVELLVGSTTAKQKQNIKQRLKDGEISILVGTHAVIQEDVEFNNLSLCICDEQQRFGVAQRSSLLSKTTAPDVLVMSATPIPRTLSLIFYGDLDITTIPDKPSQRIEIQTGIVPEYKYNDMLAFIRTEILGGRQAYFVCPKIDGDEEGAVMSATETYERISALLPDVKVGLLHGRMKEKEKNAVMESFKNNEINLLVSTTVIEVGVDVPNASVMVIYNAERFGLSQLHQLRGRVGRSDIKSYCFLTTASTDGKAIERLRIIKDNSDGFKISEYDYKLRGSGDFMGSRQSGKFIKDLGDLNYSTESIFLAKRISDDAFERGEGLEYIKQVALEKYARLKDIALN